MYQTPSISIYLLRPAWIAPTVDAFTAPFAATATLSVALVSLMASLPTLSVLVTPLFNSYVPTAPTEPKAVEAATLP